MLKINNYALDRGGAERNHLVDVIKGVCILFVIFSHYAWSDEQRHKMLFPFWIDMAVPMFMVVSGYVGALSFYNKKIENLKDCFLINSIMAKCARFMLPFTVAFLFEFLLDAFLSKSFSFKRYIVSFFYGGEGPGNYYIPIMIQFVFLFPFIYFIVRRYGFFGALIIFFANAAYEFFQRLYGVNERCYRLLLLRYVFAISFGCYLSVYKDEIIKKIWLCASFLIGLGFIFLVEYTSYEPKIIVYWTRTSFLACLYLVPIAYVILKRDLKFGLAPLELLGKASFNIFLTQMVYYFLFSDLVYGCIQNQYVRIIVNTLVCCAFGVLFYHIESPVTKKLIKRINSLDINIANKINSVFLRRTK